MNSEKNTTKGSASRNICTVTGLPVLRKPEWTYSGVGEGHRITVEVIGNNILFTRNLGYATLPDVENAVSLTERVVNEATVGGRPYVHILDYSNLKGVALDGRKYFINSLKDRKQKPEGMIFYGTSPIFSMSINLARRLNVVPFKTHIVKDYSEAVKLALEILQASEIEPDVSPTINGMSKPLANPGTPLREIITRDDWSMETDNYSVYFEIIDDDILHSVSAGTLDENIIEKIRNLREKVITSGIMPNVSYYYVIAMGALEKAGWKARRLYIESGKEWYKKYPFRMVIFYGGSRMLRATFNLARPFLPFDARMVDNLEEALELIAEEKTKRKKTESLPAGKDTAPEPAASEQTQQYIDELLRFLGSIPWDSEGLNRDMGIEPSHPLRPVFDAIELIKNDMDELSQERTKAEEKLRKSEDRYRALFDKNPIETIVVDRKGIITEYNLTKEKSGDRLPDINTDVMYKDYAGKHKINMFEELAECIESGIPKEFPEQGYKDKFLYIRIAPFSEGAIITSIDITGQKQVEERIKRLNSILKAIRNVNQIIAVERDRNSLLQKACNILIEARGYDVVWLGFSRDGETFATVKGAGFREDISRFSKHVIGGDHPPCIRRMIAEKQKLLIIDKPRECGDCFFKDACASNKAIIIRVEYADRFYGLIAILFAPDVTADEEEKELLKEVAGDIGIALRGIEMEETLIESEQRLAGIINFLPDATFAIDLEGKVVIWNRAIEEMTGVKAEDILGKENYEYALPFYGARRPILIDLVFNPDSEIEKKYSFIRREGDTLLAETEVSFIDGRNSLMWVKASPIYDLQGNVAGAIESIRDIIYRKRAEKELEQSYEKLQVTLDGTINALVATTEWRDPYTAGHQQRVARLACAIAEDMNLSEEQIREIHMSALIHDIGKINVPAEILSKPGQLSEFEFKIIQTHSQVGYDILKEIEFSWPIAQIVLQHHERMNGSGYPQGLKGEEILPEARILAVADVVEAMSSHRPYRPALSTGKALEEISRNKGILYDPDVVDACVRVLTKKGFTFKKVK